MKTAIVLNCGQRITRPINADKVICADGGYLYCPVKADYIVGDLDSLSSPPNDVTLIKHNPKKNDTDGTLAVEYAVKNLGATEIEIFGALGGRTDHVLGNLTLLALARSLGAKCVAREDGLDVQFSGVGTFTLDVEKGETLSVIPYGGNALVKNYSGLEYPLVNLLLTPLDTRGISNVTTDKKITLDVAEGEILVFRYFNK